MGKWRVVAAVITAVFLVACSRPSTTSPQLLRSPDGFSASAFESQNAQVRPDGSLELLLDTPDIAVKALSVTTIGVRGKVTLEVANLSGTPAQLDPPPVEAGITHIKPPGPK